MRSIRHLTVLAAVFLLVASATAARATVVGIEGTLGFHSFELGAVNDSLASFNDLLGTNFDELHSGSGLNLALRVWPSDRWMLRFGIETVIAESKSTNGGELSYETGPGFLTATATYFFAQPKPWRLGIGAGVGATELLGEFKGPGGNIDITGSGPEVHGQFEAEVAFTKRAALVTQLGYRYAKVSDTMFDDASTDPELVTDLSGAFFRIGMSYDWR